MSFALNEVEAMAKRATRGAGYPWGLAEEAAKATRWLCARGLDGCAILAGLLNAGFGPALADHTPGDLTGDWQATGALCPLATGATLSDMANRLDQGPVTLHRVRAPGLILPFAAMTARRMTACVTLTCDAATIVTDGTGLTGAASLPDHADRLILSIGGTPPAPTQLASRATPAPAAWQTLGRFAQRTYAPATEESRLLGAGAGLSDND
jgi:hypothetical protein